MEVSLDVSEGVGVIEGVGLAVRVADSDELVEGLVDQLSAGVGDAKGD